MDLLVLVVEDRRLDRPVEELVGVAAEELVERVLAGDVDGQAAPAAPGAAPHLAQRRDGARERHDDGGVERADVDAELQRVGRDDRAAARRASAGPRARGAAAACSRRGRARRGRPARAPRRQPSATILRHQLDAPCAT